MEKRWNKRKNVNEEKLNKVITFFLEIEFQRGETENLTKLFYYLFSC